MGAIGAKVDERMSKDEERYAEIRKDIERLAEIFIDLQRFEEIWGN